MSGPAFEAIRLTLAVAGTAIVLVALPGVPLAYLLARREFPGKALVAALVGLPLVLPPTAVGYLLLELLARDGLLGPESLGFDPRILFTWRGAVLAAAVMALPLVVRTARVAFEGVDPRLEQASRSLGEGSVRTFVGVTLPLAGRGLVAALILGFTRAMGEFGATVIVAGNIPGETQTLASALWSAQQVGAEGEARLLLGFALVLGLGAILASEALVRRAPERIGVSSGAGSRGGSDPRPEADR